MAGLQHMRLFRIGDSVSHLPIQSAPTPLFSVPVCCACALFRTLKWDRFARWDSPSCENSVFTRYRSSWKTVMRLSV